MVNRIPGLPRNTFQKSPRQTKDEGRGTTLFLLSSLVFLLFSGCGPKYTYPANSVPKSIEDIDRKEYKIDSIARVIGKTVGAVVYLDSIMDAKGQIPKEVNETMSKVMQTVTRVALSTDRPLDFCTVVIRDRLHGNELTITRFLDDTKRANAEAIGIEESISRTVFGQGKYKPETETWDSFVLKEIRLENFLTEQIVQRIRFGYSKENSQEENPKSTILVDGVFNNETDKRSFHFSIISIKSEDPKKVILGVFKTINETLMGYSFTAFDAIEVQDYLNRKKLVVDRQTLLDYQLKKVTEDQIMAKCLLESQSIQEAFKLFGFNLPQDSADKDIAPRAATP